MKTILKLTTTLVVAASLGVPLFAVAQSEYACDTPCSAGMYCDSDGTCKSISQTLTQTTSSGGINLGVLRPYSEGIIGIINTIFVPVLIAVAFIVFLWGTFKYFIWHGENESEKAEGRKYAMWGIIGFVVIFSVWALVNIVISVFNLTGNAPRPPVL